MRPRRIAKRDTICNRRLRARARRNRPRRPISFGHDTALSILYPDINHTKRMLRGAPARSTWLAAGLTIAAAFLARVTDVEQTTPGDGAPPTIVASFDGLGVGFAGPQGTTTARNPSDNSLAVGPDHIVQIVNSRMAIYTKKGARFDTTGRVLYGPVETRNVFRGFTGPCDQRNNGDAVVRYDQLADRWLIVMPIFGRIQEQRDDRPPPHSGEPARKSLPGVAGQPGPAVRL